MSTHGLEQVKRVQALRYFTWQWRWGQIIKSEQMRFLLRNSRPSDMLRTIWRPGPLDQDRWSGTTWSVADRWLYVFATRLIWAYAARSDPSALALEEPELGDPFPVHFRGRLISQDLANTALEIDAAARGGGGSPRNIIEVGAGYGRTAYALLSLHPEATYTIVDIEPTIDVSRWYLTQLFDTDRLTFVQADQIDQIEDRTFDLGLSVSSLQEMTPQQVGGYLQLFDRVVDGHVYLKQWENWHNPVDDTDMVFENYPFPEAWTRTLWERCAVQTQFMQGVWRTSRERDASA